MNFYNNVICMLCTNDIELIRVLFNETHCLENQNSIFSILDLSKSRCFEKYIFFMCKDHCGELHWLVFLLCDSSIVFFALIAGSSTRA